MDASSLMRTGGRRLLAAGFVSGAAESRTLLACAMGLDSRAFSRALLMGDTVAPQAAARFETLLTGRLAGTPVQHLTGTAPFRHLELAVGPGVFIPRPETELVAQAALDFLSERHGDAALEVADLCTGSGALALALATERPHTAVTAVELSDAALAYTQRNVGHYGAAASAVGSSVTVVKADALSFAGGPFAAIVSNPPYVPAGQETVEVAASDPAMALYGGGAHGMDFPRALIAHVPGLLVEGGLFVMEHAETQSDAVAAAFVTAGLAGVSAHADYTGRVRFTTGMKEAMTSGAHL